jgi:hypothetical protein
MAIVAGNIAQSAPAPAVLAQVEADIAELTARIAEFENLILSGQVMLRLLSAGAFLYVEGGGDLDPEIEAKACEYRSRVTRATGALPILKAALAAAEAERATLTDDRAMGIETAREALRAAIVERDKRRAAAPVQLAAIADARQRVDEAQAALDSLAAVGALSANEQAARLKAGAAGTAVPASSIDPVKLRRDKFEASEILQERRTVLAQLEAEHPANQLAEAERRVGAAADELTVAQARALADRLKFHLHETMKLELALAGLKGKRTALPPGITALQYHVPRSVFSLSNVPGNRKPLVEAVAWWHAYGVQLTSDPDARLDIFDAIDRGSIWLKFPAP